MPALLVSLSILAVLLTLLLLFSLGPPHALLRRRHRLSRHEMASQQQQQQQQQQQVSRGRSRHRPGIRGAADLAAMPEAACAHPLASSFADDDDEDEDGNDVNRPLLGRWLDENHDDSGLEMDEATWPRPSGERAGTEVLHWHGTNMLNTSWGWMA